VTTGPRIRGGIRAPCGWQLRGVLFSPAWPGRWPCFGSSWRRRASLADRAAPGSSQPRTRLDVEGLARIRLQLCAGGRTCTRMVFDVARPVRSPRPSLRISDGGHGLTWALHQGQIATARMSRWVRRNGFVETRSASNRLRTRVRGRAEEFSLFSQAVWAPVTAAQQGFDPSQQFFEVEVLVR